MNKTSRTDEPLGGEGFNQSPNALSADLTKNQDLKGRANARELRGDDPRTRSVSSQTPEDHVLPISTTPEDRRVIKDSTNDAPAIGHVDGNGMGPQVTFAAPSGGFVPPGRNSDDERPTRIARVKHYLFTFAKFVGPGFMVAVAYSEFSTTTFFLGILSLANPPPQLTPGTMPRISRREPRTASVSSSSSS